MCRWLSLSKIFKSTKQNICDLFLIGDSWFLRDGSGASFSGRQDISLQTLEDHFENRGDWRLRIFALGVSEFLRPFPALPYKDSLVSRKGRSFWWSEFFFRSFFKGFLTTAFQGKEVSLIKSLIIEKKLARFCSFLKVALPFYAARVNQMPSFMGSSYCLCHLIAGQMVLSLWRAGRLVYVKTNGISDGCDPDLLRAIRYGLCYALKESRVSRVAACLVLCDTQDRLTFLEKSAEKEFADFSLGSKFLLEHVPSDHFFSSMAHSAKRVRSWLPLFFSHTLPIPPLHFIRSFLGGISPAACVAGLLIALNCCWSAFLIGPSISQAPPGGSDSPFSVRQDQSRLSFVCNFLKRLAPMVRENGFKLESVQWQERQKASAPSLLLGLRMSGQKNTAKTAWAAAVFAQSIRKKIPNIHGTVLSGTKVLKSNKNKRSGLIMVRLRWLS